MVTLIKLLGFILTWFDLIQLKKDKKNIETVVFTKVGPQNKRVFENHKKEKFFMLLSKEAFDKFPRMYTLFNKPADSTPYFINLLVL